MSGSVTKRRTWKLVVFLSVTLIVMLVMLEYGLRAIKSVTLDGTLYLAAPTINNEPHPTYGWISPASRRYEKTDACYGDGVVSYNEAGFRAPPLAEATDASPKVCILGDSTMQGYQMPDGSYLPHLLAAELAKHHDAPYVLPLAVLGYGSLQRWLLYQDFCRDIQPDVVVWSWDDNDPTNDSYLADRNAGPNNVRPRPYLEDGEIVMRRSYPIHLTDQIDSLLTVKMLNGLIMLALKEDDETIAAYREQGWAVADSLAERLAQEVEHPIALVSRDATRAIEMFKRHGFELAIYDPFPDEERCLPRDLHPNTRGHQRMLNALLPVVEEVLQPAESPLRVGAVPGGPEPE